MVKPYLAVLNTYWSSRTVRIEGVVVLVFCALLLIGRQPDRIGPWPVIPVLLVSSVFAFSFAALTKEQFATPRARLLPQFNKHHLVVAGIIGGGLWLLTAGVLAGTTASSFLATASLLAAFYALMAWGTCLQPVILLVLVGLIYGFCCTTRGQAQMTALICGQVPYAAPVLLAAGAGGAILVGWRLSRLTEEHREYDLRFTAPSSTGELSARQRRAISRSWWTRLQGQRLEGVLSRPVTGTWRGARRLRAAGGGPSTAAIAVAVLASSWIVMRLLDPRGTLSPQLAFVALLGILASWRMFLVKALSQELVRPVERRELMRQVGLVLLTDLFVFWFTVAIMSAAGWAVLSPGVLLDPRAWCGVAVALCGIPLFVGVAGLALRIRSDLGFWTAGMLIYMAGMMAVVVTMSGRPSPTVIPWLTAGLLMAGAGACFGAYRVWLAGDIN